MDGVFLQKQKKSRQVFNNPEEPALPTSSIPSWTEAWLIRKQESMSEQDESTRPGIDRLLKTKWHVRFSQMKWILQFPEVSGFSAVYTTDI